MAETLIGKGQVNVDVFTTDTLLGGTNATISPIIPGGIDQYTPVCFHFDGNYDNAGNDSSYVINTSNYLIKNETPKQNFGQYVQAADYTQKNTLLTASVPAVSIADFTIDFWYNANGKTSAYNQIKLFRSTSGTGQYSFFYLQEKGYSDTYAEIGFAWSSSDDSTVSGWDSNTILVGVNEWAHIALERYNGVIHCYVNGNLVDNATYSNEKAGELNFFGRLSTGSSITSKLFLLDDFRISTIARYQGQSFTPPSFPYAETSGEVEAYRLDVELPNSIVYNKGTDNNFIIGGGTQAGNINDAVVIGHAAVGSGSRCVAIGNSAVASGVDAVAIGMQSVARSGGATTVGQYNSSYGSNAVAVGKSCLAASSGSIAVGVEAQSLLPDGIAIGSANVNGSQGIAIGPGAVVSNNYGVALGPSSVVGSKSVALGDTARVYGAHNAVALGASAYVNASSAVQIGSGSNTTAETLQFFSTPIISGGYVVNDCIDKATLASTTSGYDSTKTQVLKNVSGTLMWVDE